MVKPDSQERLVVGLSGASGVAYGIRLLEALRDLGIESHLVMTKPAEMTIGYETKLTPKQVAAKADHRYAIGDIGAPIASGSFKTAGMIVAPCSVRTMSEIATGVTTSLLTRAADVTLEGTAAADLDGARNAAASGASAQPGAACGNGRDHPAAGAGLLCRAQNLADLVDQMVGKALDLLGHEWPGLKRWGEELSNGARKSAEKKP